MTKSSDIKAIGAFVFDPANEFLTGPDGAEVALRPQTQRVLALLAAEDGALVTKDRLMSEVWADTFVTDDSLVQCISEIRKALGPEAGKLLKTVPKQGYRLETGEAERARDRRSLPLRLLAAVAVVVFVAAGLAFWATRPGPGPEGVTIAVLPFTSIGSAEADDYMSVGLAEDLLTDLARVDALTVLGRGATFGLVQGHDTAQELHASHGVTHVVDGTLQRSGDRLRISVQLVDAETGASLWAERYDRDLGDIFALQDDVRARIFAALAVRLAPGEEARLTENRSRAASAYDLLLQGRYLESALTRDGVTRAIALYERAVAIDPTYAEAHARLANMYDFVARFGWVEDTAAAHAKAIASAKTAVRLAPGLPYAHWALGRVTARLEAGPEATKRAIAEFNEAIALDPNFADAYGFLALVLIGDGRTDEARAAIERAFLLNPEPPSWYAQNRGIVAYFSGDYEAAIADFEGATEQNVTAAFAHLWLAAAYAMAGRVDDAEWEAEEAQALEGDFSISGILSANSVIHHPPFVAAYGEGLRAAGLSD